MLLFSILSCPVRSYNIVMLKLSASISNLPILSLRSGGRIATAAAPFINPHNLKILGWWCDSKFSTEHLILLTEDVREITPQGIVVDDNDALVQQEELIRHKEIIDAQFQPIDKLVKTKHRKLGKVSDYSFNDGMFIQKLYVNRPLTSIFSGDATLIIDRTQIIEITDDYILVKDTEVEEGASELAAEPAVS